MKLLVVAAGIHTFEGHKWLKYSGRIDFVRSYDLRSEK